MCILACCILCFFNLTWPGLAWPGLHDINCIMIMVILFDGGNVGRGEGWGGGNWCSLVRL